VTNDHRVFFPFMGLNLAAVWTVWVLAGRLAERSTVMSPRRVAVVGAVLASLLLAGHAAATSARNRVWLNDETLWADVAAKSPRNGRGLMNYGLTHMRRGRLEEARDLFLRAEVLTPNYSFLAINLGVVNDALGDHAAAERYFTRALALDPSQPVAHYYYARWLAARGRGPEAAVHLERSIALSPGEMGSRHLLMGLLAARGAESDLRAAAEAALRVARTDAVAQAYAAGGTPLVPATNDYAGWFALGWSHTQAERHVEAAQAYWQAVAADASSADSWSNLGWTLGKLGFFDAAIAPLERAVALRPGWDLARNNLAWVRREAGGVQR
jgi:protein O-mannosyl-transferase